MSLLVASGVSYPTCHASDLQVQTSSGTIEGFVNPPIPDVHQFLGVPYSLPPTGSRRWLPPSKPKSKDHVNASSIGPACPQLLVSARLPLNISVYSPFGGNQTEFFPPDDFSEDCLTLNIWTPRNAHGPMPVIVWFFGGGFTQGSTNSLYFNPESWVQRTQEHIVVTVNFRSNIFGFPNAPQLAEQNLGLLDQRLALEWVRDNIANFGGDPSKIVDWGESSGAIAVDFLDLAFASDPIVSGKIMDSTTALFPVSETADLDQANFTAVAKVFNCSSLDCLRNVSWQDIEAYLLQDPSLNFTPVADERIVFSNTTQRYEMGLFSSVPAIIGTNQHELNALGLGLSETRLDTSANQSFLCTSAAASRFREAYGRTTYRFLYEGNFSNISPANFTGAYHASEIPLIMGTTGKFHGVSTEYEISVGEKMQDLWLAFAKDPVSGLRNAGWGSYGEGKAIVIGDGKVTTKEIGILDLDGIC
jgi:acetylcholinesterase